VPAGAESWGLEVPLYFGRKGFAETPSLKRSNAHDVVAAECRAVREGVGLLDITGFSRYEVIGAERGSVARWADGHDAARNRAARGCAVLLGHDGRLKGDLTLFNWGDGNTWWIMGSYYLREWHMRWFHDHMADGCHGARPRRGHGGLLPLRSEIPRGDRKAVRGPVGALPFMGCGDFDIGLMRCKVGRMSVTGELGYEIHCRMGDHISLREALLKAGAEEGITEYGFNALLSLRLEKSFGIWSRNSPRATRRARPAWTAGSTGTRASSSAARQRWPSATATDRRRVVTLEVDATDADASGFEPVWKDGKLVGFVTSGGYGHTLGKSLAMAMVDTA
jgi:dimethylglycine dehydrogenase